LSYFAKPYFIPYDQWFDDHLDKDKVNILNNNSKDSSNLHDFFFRQSNNQVGASENNFELRIQEKSMQIISNNSSKDFLENSFIDKKEKDNFIKKSYKNKLKFGFSRYLFYRLSIILCIIIFGSSIFFIAQDRTQKSNTLNKILEIKQGF
tara:strand:- start:96 stop:545 length:450 start_codon:yes stop_codon:yes gene_type:complete